LKRLLLAIAVLASAAYVGCKQADGDRCQVNDDCASGMCNTAKGTCAVNLDTDDIDAAVVIDAPADAAIDSPPDAPAD
jgi:hypothetical protein